ncbi:zinc carboxypeptidase, partial [Colletotrichum sojae]
MRLFALLTALSLLAAASGKRVSYDGYQVLRVKTGARQVEVDQKLAKVKHDEWDGVENSHVDVVIAPAQLPRFRALGLDHRVMHEDLGASIAAESAARPAWKRSIDDMAWYDAYHPYDEHKTYVETLHKAFPNNSKI